MAEGQFSQTGVVCGSISVKKNNGERLHLLPYSIGGSDQGTLVNASVPEYESFGSILSFEYSCLSKSFIEQYFAKLSVLCRNVAQGYRCFERGRKLNILSGLLSSVNEALLEASGVYQMLDNRNCWSQVKRTILIEDDDGDRPASEFPWQVCIELDTVNENGFPPMPTNTDHRFALYNPYTQKFTY